MVDDEIVRSVYRRYKLNAKWGEVLVSEYLSNIRRTCTKESAASLENWNLLTYAVGLLGSESRKEYKSGARLLTTLIEQGKDVRPQLLLSRPKIQKLIDTLGWRCNPGDDSGHLIRLLVSKIVADVAGNIHLAQYPGAANCIASLFEDDELPPQENLSVVVTRNGRTAEGTNRSQKEGDQEGENEMRSINTEGDIYNENELILEGLTILERLASNHQNCREICNTPSLISVITAPIYSDTLIKDIEDSACREVAYRSFKVLHQLIRSPGCTGRRMRREISSNDHAVSNLKKILDPDTKASQELQMGAMVILTEIAMDLSINLAEGTNKNLITMQLRIFVGADSTAASKQLKIVAGRTLALLSSKSERNSFDTITISERDGNANRRLVTKITFDGNTCILYKITAAKILVNLCTHCSKELPEEYVKGTLLPQVLTRILVPSNVEPQQIESSQSNIWKCFTGICGSASQGDDIDVENRLPNHNLQNQQPFQENEEQIMTNELLEALLSLTLLTYDKLIHVDGFDAVFQENAPADKLVARLKAIVDENCKATPVSLRIVKLCGQIAISMMQRQGNRYTAHFKDQKFVESLSKAVGIMSKLESCILVTGSNNCGMKKKVRPLLFHLEKEVQELVR